MGQTEIEIFIVLTGVLVVIFITGILLFIFQYRQRRIISIKEKHQLEKEHQISILNTRLESQQYTMEFIGQELHDSVTQKLTLAFLYTQRMEFLNSDQEVKIKLTEISKIINDALAELRDLSKNLAEGDLAKISLTDLIQNECINATNTGLCNVVFRPSGDSPDDYRFKNSLLRILQEFIQNSLKHSKCRNIYISTRYVNKGFEVSASDDGLGFDMTTIASNGIGLNNMKRRMKQIGGTFNMVSEPGKGVRLTLFIPEQHEKNQDEI